MSTNLYWEPVKPRRAATFNQLKYFMGPKLWDHDGTLSGSPAVVNATLIPYLEGLRDGTENVILEEECNVLISAIQEHGEIELWIAE